MDTNSDDQVLVTGNQLTEVQLRTQDLHTGVESRETALQSHTCMMVTNVFSSSH